MIKKTSISILLFFAIVATQAQTKVNPGIKNYGGISPIPYAVEKPDAKLHYKVIVDVSTGNDKPEMVHEWLEKTASVINLHALGGVSKNKLDLILVIHGGAAQFVVNNAAYKQKYNLDTNPNLGLFAALQKAGVKMFVCGQTLEKRKIAPATIAPEIKVALSAITTLTTYQLKGYTLLKF